MSCVIERNRNGVQVIIEQVGVSVECPRCGRVAEHPLHRFHVRASADSETRSRVAEVVNCKREGE